MSSDSTLHEELQPKRYSFQPDSVDYTEAVTRYNAWWPCPDGSIGLEADAARKKRQKGYNQLAIDYYDLVSPSYEYGWGQQFHFCPMMPNTSIKDSLIEYEILIGKMMGLEAGMKVLDVGCGVAGPARTIAKTFDCRVVGLVNSEWLVKRGTILNKKAGLEDKVEVVQGDFHHLPFPDNTFDAAYAIEAICYAPDLTLVYNEIRRVLKPGAPFGLSEWVMTNQFDPTIKTQRIIRDQIERGNGIAKMPLVLDVRDGLKQCGLNIIHEEDMAHRSKPRPWYYPLLGMLRYVTCKEDFMRAISMERRVVVPLIDMLYWLLVKIKQVPKELPAGFEVMKTCTKSVAIGSREGIFSPMMLFVSRNVK